MTTSMGAKLRTLFYQPTHKSDVFFGHISYIFRPSHSTVGLSAMAVIRKYKSPAHACAGKKTHEIFIEVDGRVVGSIDRCPDERYVAITKGWVPTIDGISGISLNDVWAKIVKRVQSGGVFFVSTQPITDVIE